MKKYFLLKVLVFIGFVPSVFSQNSQQNILFIAVDDMKPLLNCYGYEQMHTPNIDKLAERGVMFTNAHCQQAVCGPTRASLLTGMRPDYTGVWDLKTRMRNVNPEILAMPEFFQNKGYATVAIGKIYDPRCVDKQYDAPSWSIPYKESSVYIYPEEYGAPALSYYASDENKKQVAKLTEEAKAKGVQNIHAYVAERFKPSTEKADMPDEAYMDGQIANNAIRYMEQLAEETDPFFLAVGFKRPHLPFAAPKKYWDLYSTDDINLAEYRQKVENGVDLAYHNHGELQSYTDIPRIESFSDIFSELLPDEKQRELIHGYYASVSFIDAQIGLIMEQLTELGLDKNTTIVLWGDHGWHLGDHALWCKHSNFEQATRVPLIISTPDKDTGTYKHPVEFVDIFPTLCEATGLEIPQHLQGKSLMPAIKNNETIIKEYAVSQFDRGPNHGYSLRTNQYRFTIWLKDKYRTFSPFKDNLVIDCELYDYSTDPNETVNLYRSKEHQHIVEQMMNHFKEFVSLQNKELIGSGSMPKNAEVRKPLPQLNIDGNFEKPFTDNWKTTKHKGAEVDFEVLKDGPFGENTLKIDVIKLGEKPWDIAITSAQVTKIEKGQTVSMIFSAKGNKMRIILKSKNGETIVEKLEPGANTFLHHLSFPIPETDDWRIKFQFTEIGTYYLNGIITEIE